jgi:uncharacterized Zn-binding protein involved in type VI secretion
MHVCPKPVTPPPTPPTVHGPGTIMASGASKVYVNGMLAAVAGDTCTCVLEPGNTIQAGSSTVKFGGQQAARMLDMTTHFSGGQITVGSENVFIGG